MWRCFVHVNGSSYDVLCSKALCSKSHATFEEILGLVLVFVKEISRSCEKNLTAAHSVLSDGFLASVGIPYSLFDEGVVGLARPLYGVLTLDDKSVRHGFIWFDGQSVVQIAAGVVYVRVRVAVIALAAVVDLDTGYVLGRADLLDPAYSNAHSGCSFPAALVWGTDTSPLALYHRGRVLCKGVKYNTLYFTTRVK